MEKEIINKAKQFCLKNKHRLTHPRLEVLKIISQSTKPIKAYEILNKLGNVIKNPKPPTAYRSIDFWLKYNFIHKIQSLNAYLLCTENHLHKGSQYLICDGCGKVTESHFCKLPSIISKNIKKNFFNPTQWNLEINGLCSKCS